jgi:hypothetical protein
MYKIIGADQKEYGPVTIDQIRQWITEGRANGQTLVQAEGSAEWKPLASFPELSALLPAAPSPAFGAPVAPVPPQADPIRRLGAPGIALIVLGILIILGSIGDLVFSMRSGGQPMPQIGNPQIDQILKSLEGGMRGPMATFWGLVHTVVGVVIMMAGFRLRQARSYSLVMTAAILAMIPCTAGCCCLIGLPIGIWVLMSIKEPSVKAVFK